MVTYFTLSGAEEWCQYEDRRRFSLPMDPRSVFGADAMCRRSLWLASRRCRALAVKLPATGLRGLFTSAYFLFQGAITLISEQGFDAELPGRFVICRYAVRQQHSFLAIQRFATRRAMRYEQYLLGALTTHGMMSFHFELPITFSIYDFQSLLFSSSCSQPSPQSMQHRLL